MSNITIEQAMNRLKQAMKDEPDYAYGWHANIATSCLDAIKDTKERLPLDSYSDYHVASNEAASRFMRICFDAETSLHMLEK